MPPCRSCRRPVAWVTLVATGGRVAVEATPTPDGAIALDQPRGHGRVLAAGEEYSGLRYEAHDCPEGGHRPSGQLGLVDAHPIERRTPARCGASASGGYSAATLRAWTCPGCKQMRFGAVCKDCRERRPVSGPATGGL